MSVLASDIVRKPANYQAAKLLMKSPWWAKCPEAEPALAQLNSIISSRAWVDLTKQPPTGVDNRIGQKFSGVVVIGYCERRDNGIHRCQRRQTKPAWWVGEGWSPRGMRIKRCYEHVWYIQCLTCCGVFHMKQTGINKSVKHGWTCPDCSHPEFPKKSLTTRHEFIR
jgi:hypothetical protein